MLRNILISFHLQIHSAYSDQLPKNYCTSI